MKPKVVALLVLIVIGLIIVLQNFHVVSFRIFFWAVDMSLIILTLLLAPAAMASTSTSGGGWSSRRSRSSTSASCRSASLIRERQSEQLAQWSRAAASARGASSPCRKR